MKKVHIAGTGRSNRTTKPTTTRHETTSAEFGDPDPAVVDRLGLANYHDIHPGRLGKIKLKLKGGAGPCLPSFAINRTQRGGQKSLVPISPAEEVVPASLDDLQVEQSTRPRISNEENARLTSILCRDLLHITPAADILPGLAQASVVATSAPDATYGERLALGRVLDQTSRRRAGVIAAVAGPVGTLIRFNLLEKYNFIVDDSHEDEENTSWKVATKVIGWWDHQSTPVRQVTFSQEAGDFGEYLAVRFQQSVALLRPEFRKHLIRVIANPLKRSEHPSEPSSVHPRFFAEIQAQELNGDIFAHTAFNPVKQEIAIINITGHWALWSYHYESRADPLNQKHPILQHRNWLGGDNEFVCDYDGWARVTWTRDGSFLLVTRRRNALCYDTRNGCHQISAPALVTAYDWSERDWIVDVKPCPLRRSAWWVLTTKRVISLSFADHSTLIWGVEQGPIVVDISEQHFGNTDNLDVSLDVVDLHDTILVIVRGNQDVPVWSHTFRIAEAGSRFSVLSGDTSRFSLVASTAPSQADKRVSNEPMSGLVFLPIFKSLKYSKDAFPETRKSDPTLLRALLCSERHGVIEQLFSFQSLAKDVATYEAVMPSRSRSSSLTSVKTLNDSFIVDDAEVSDDPDELRAPGWRLNHFRRPPPARSWPRLDYTSKDRVLKAMHGTYISSGGVSDEVDSQTDHAGVSGTPQDIIEDALKGHSDLDPGTHTMLEAMGSISYDEFTDISDSFRGLLQETRSGIANTGLRRQATLSTTTLSSSALSSFLARSQVMHDLTALHSLLRTANSNSTLAAPGEQTARTFSHLLKRITIDCFLSSHSLTIAPNPETLGPNDSAQEESATPIHGRKSDFPSSSPKRDVVSSSPLPPIPDSDDLYHPGAGPNLDPALPESQRHPYSKLASLGILGPVEKPESSLDVVDEKWDLGTEPTGERWRHGQMAPPGRAASYARQQQQQQQQQQRQRLVPSSQTMRAAIRPKTAPVPPRPLAERGTQLMSPFATHAASRGQASQSGSQFQMSSQSVPRASQSLPFGSQGPPLASQRLLSSQSTLPSASQFRLSQTPRGKKRKAGF